jgi:mono/diheme cytochrome c family protein
MKKGTTQLILFACIFFIPVFAMADELINRGYEVYKKYCIGCHGEKGDGKGKAATLLVVKPRDFTTGVFKFKSTPQGALPTDEDLMNTITKGLPGSSMPSYVLVPERERRAVIEYIKTFSARWIKERLTASINIPPVPLYIDSPESIKRGAEAYKDNGCDLCHGDTGDGRGSSAEELEDMWGNRIKPRNFKRGIYRGGSTPGDIFRTLTNGIEGTPMPVFSDIAEEERWHLISFLLSLKPMRKNE